MSPKLRAQLIDALRLDDGEVYDEDGLIDLADFGDGVDVLATVSSATRPGLLTQARLHGGREPVDRSG